MRTTTPLHELAVLTYSMDQEFLQSTPKIPHLLQLFSEFNGLEGKCKFQIFHMYSFMNEYLKDHTRNEKVDKHYANILLYEHILDNIIRIKTIYETQFTKLQKEQKVANLEEFTIKSEEPISKLLPLCEHMHLKYLEKKLIEFGLVNIFNSEILKPKHIKRIEYFYAPWCKFCSEFQPTWMEWKKHFENSKIEFQKFNSDNPKADRRRKLRSVISYPTIVLVYEDETFSTYDGQRDLKSLIDLVEQNMNEKIN
jgi:thiol-disulfide isomerase/thioredoxin